MVCQDGEGYFYTDEPYRADYTNIWGSQGEVYSVKDKLFSNVEVPQITWDNEPVKLEMTLRRNLSGIFIFDKLEGEEKPTPTCLEDCTPETTGALINCIEHLCETINEFSELLDIYKE